MNKYLKLPLYVAMTAMMGMSVAACDDENDPGTGGSGELTPQEQALKDVIADYVDMTVVPTYKGMADAAANLGMLWVMNEKFESTKNYEYRFEIPVIMNGKEIARSSAVYTREELERIDKFRNRLVGATG